MRHLSEGKYEHPNFHLPPKTRFWLSHALSQMNHIPSRFVTFPAGPFKVNGVPLRRVNQAYVIGTSTKVDISGVNVDKFDDKYFSKEVKRTKKKTEGEFFENEKKVSFLGPSPLTFLVQDLSLKITFFLKH